MTPDAPVLFHADSPLFNAGQGARSDESGHNPQTGSGCCRSTRLNRDHTEKNGSTILDPIVDVVGVHTRKQTGPERVFRSQRNSGALPFAAASSTSPLPAVRSPWGPIGNSKYLWKALAPGDRELKPRDSAHRAVVPVRRSPGTEAGGVARGPMERSATQSSGKQPLLRRKERDALEPNFTLRTFRSRFRRTP